MLNLDCLFYLAGFGLGDLINIIEQDTKGFQGKEKLLGLLQDFYDKRNVVIHNSLSSRIVLFEEVNQGLVIGENIIKEIENMIEDGETKEIV